MVDVFCFYQKVNDNWGSVIHQLKYLR